MNNLQESANSFLESYGELFDDFNNINRLEEASESLMITKVVNEYKDFKTNNQWISIRNQLKKIRNNPGKIDEQFKLLMDCKSMLIKGRNNIADIDEDGWANFGFIMAVLSVSIGITVACLAVPGLSATMLGNVGIFASILTPVYTFIRGYYMAYGGRDSYNSYAAVPNQKNVGSLSKQVAVAHMDKMIADVNKKITYVLANKALNVNKAAVLIADKCSDQFLQKLDSLESDIVRGNAADIKNIMGSKYFKDFENKGNKGNSGKDNDQKNRSNQGKNNDSHKSNGNQKAS